MLRWPDQVREAPSTKAELCTVGVEYLGLLQNVLGIGQDEFDVASGCTVRALLQKALERHGKPFGACVFKADGQLRPVVVVYVSGRPVETAEDWDTPLVGKSKISVVVGVQPDPGG